MSLGPGPPQASRAPVRPEDGRAHPNLETPILSLGSDCTPIEDHFVRTHFPVPSVDPDRWRLVIEGDVRHPRSWTLTDLAALPQVEMEVTLECAGNSRKRFETPVEGEIIWGDGAVSTARWGGVRLSELLPASHVGAGVRELLFEGVDRPSGPDPLARGAYARSLPVSLLSEAPDLLLATRVNGRPLPPDHGFPARLIVPDWYAMASVKWLGRIATLREPFTGHYQSKRYVYEVPEKGTLRRDPVTRMRVKSILTSLREGDHVREGESLELAGKAWSGDGPIARVEVDAGDGWSRAEVRPGQGPHAWSSWTLRTTVPSGPTWQVRIRATDAAGNAQPETPLENVRQYGGNGIHMTNLVVSRRGLVPG